MKLKLNKTLLFILISCFAISLIEAKPRRNRKSARTKNIDRVSNVRLGMNIYRDSSVQRGITFRLDYVTNIWLKSQYFGAFIDLDTGLSFTEEEEPPSEEEPQLTEPTEPTIYDNSRSDFGLMYGVNIITTLATRFYMGILLGYTNFQFTDSLKIEPFVYKGFFYGFTLGAEIKLPYENFYLFIELYLKRIPAREDNVTVFQDSFELQQANIERWILGVSYKL